MAGYMFTLDNEDALRRCIAEGLYSTVMSDPKDRWRTPAEGTFADYATMRPGDNVYFFHDRRIYGIGEIADVGTGYCFQNFPGASNPKPVPHESVVDQMLVGSDLERPGKTQRWVVAFKPAPRFFVHGVDMDDALSSDPGAFRMLRTIWKRSFIKFDDQENQAFKNVILRLNQEALTYPTADSSVFFLDSHELHHRRVSELTSDGSYGLDARPLVSACRKGTMLSHEMAIEAALLFQLSQGDRDTVASMGRWDYLSHQVIASPFKPIDYMDRMDMFGYAWIPGHKPAISKYLVAEVKKHTASRDDVGQTMKYVDWVKDEYAHGDYSMIRAYLVAHEIPPSVEKYAMEVGRRAFTVQRRPPHTTEWTSLKLLEYRATKDNFIRLASPGTTIDTVVTI